MLMVLRMLVRNFRPTATVADVQAACCRSANDALAARAGRSRSRCRIQLALQLRRAARPACRCSAPSVVDDLRPRSTSKQVQTCRPRAATATGGCAPGSSSSAAEGLAPAARPAAAGSTQASARCRRPAGRPRSRASLPSCCQLHAAALAASAVGIAQHAVGRSGRARLRCVASTLGAAAPRRPQRGTARRCARGRTARSWRRRTRRSSAQQLLAQRSASSSGSQAAASSCQGSSALRSCTAACFSSGCFDCGQKAGLVSALTPQRAPVALLPRRTPRPSAWR